MTNQQLSFNLYQTLAMTFRKASADQTYAVLGLNEEAGEVAGKVAKFIRDSEKDPDGIPVGEAQCKLKQDLKKELGDVMWMVAAVAADVGLSLEEIAQANIDKLTDRSNRSVIGGSGDNR
jgi:NTP pyrophosphatase (non-canonical NTP hydrolase)